MDIGGLAATPNWLGDVMEAKEAGDAWLYAGGASDPGRGRERRQAPSL